MKKLAIGFLILILFTLDWAVLHDLLKDNYVMLALGLIIFGTSAFSVLKKRGGEKNEIV